MGYYLSKANQAIANMIADKLEGKLDTLTLKINNPKKLERIIRSACKLGEYSWIKDKFVIKVTEDHIIFYPKQFFFEEVEVAEEIPDKDFFSIINILVLQKKDKVDFVQCLLTPDEIESIQNWCAANSYEAIYEKEILHITKIAKNA